MSDKKKLPSPGLAPAKKEIVRDKIRTSDGVYSVNEYYIDISRRYRLAKYLTVFLLVSFILVMLSARRDYITIEGFQYLIRYLDVGSNVYNYTSDFKKIAYSADTEIKFESFRGDFVITDSTAVNIYSLSGLNVLSESSYISNPVIEKSNNHLLVYDLGGNSYAVYNTFSKLFGETLPYPITGASNSDSGLYAIVTKTQQYRSAVYIYDRNFGMISRILKDKLVMDVDIKPDGSNVLIVSAYNLGGDFCTEIMTCDPYSDTAAALVTLNNLMPVRARYVNGGFNVVCDSKLLFYNNSGILKSEYSYNGEIPVYSLITDDYTFLAFSENVIGDTQRLLIFDSNGAQVAEKRVEGQIVRLKCIGNEIYVLTSNSIIYMKIYGNASATYAIEKNSIDLVTANDSTFFLCYPSYAMSVDITTAFSATETAAQQVTEAQTETAVAAAETKKTK